MLHHRLAGVAILALIVSSVFPALAEAQTLQLTGADGRVASVDAAAIAALPRVSVPLTIHGTAHVFEGPRLIDVLKPVGVETGEALRGPALAQGVVVRAADGYAVVYGLGELDAGLRANAIILADRVDGAPLAVEDGPFRVVVEGDLRPARAMRQVTSVQVFGAPVPRTSEPRREQGVETPPNG
ncbi:hypothetical protein BH10PSE2_BH10PSE2_18010 [soil metagenome]